MVHYLHQEQVIPAPVNTVWDYFCNPNNLNEITPPYMHFEIIKGGNGKMYEGQIIEYRVQFLRGVRSLWLTEIPHVRDGLYFVDEQRVGPYHFWYHEHIFKVHPSGTKMTDRVTYVIPFGVLGDLMNKVWIAKRLEDIFNFRRQKIIELFGESK